MARRRSYPVEIAPASPYQSYQEPDGSSQFDKFRSQQDTPVFPEGSYLTAKCCSETYNECEERRFQNDRRYDKQYAEVGGYDLTTQEGGSTIIPSRVVCDYD
jgi:hypothetical protein